MIPTERRDDDNQTPDDGITPRDWLRIVLLILLYIVAGIADGRIQ